MGCGFFFGDGGCEVADNFPIICGLEGRFDCPVESLEAAAEVHHGTPFFGKGCAGDDDMSVFSGRVCKEGCLEQEVRFCEIFCGEAGICDEILAKAEKGGDFAGGEGGLDCIESGKGICCFEDEFCAGGVWIAVCGDEQVIGCGDAWDEGEVCGVEGFAEFAEHEKLFIGHPGRADDGDFFSGDVLEAGGGGMDGLPGCGGEVRCAFFNKWLGEAGFGIYVVEVEAM